MKAYRNIMFVMLLALVVSCALSVFAEQANAALSYQGSIATDNPSVGQDSFYTLILTNTGTDRLLSAGITVPANFENIENLAVTPQTWSVSHITDEGLPYFSVNQTAEGLNTGESLTITFNAANPRVAGTYIWIVNAVGTNGDATSMVEIELTSELRITTMVPILILLGIAFGISLFSLTLNRILIGHFIGWEQYQVMRKETAEFQKAQMAAARANDVKQMEKLKRKQTQITNMQQKMMKTTFLSFGFMIVPWLLWAFVLIPTFGDTSLAYIPGLGGLPMFWIYLPLSFFASTLGGRIIGINPIEFR